MREWNLKFHFRDIVRVLKDILETDPDFGLDVFFQEIILREKPKSVEMLLMNYMILFIPQLLGILLSQSMSIYCTQYYVGRRIAQIVRRI